MKFKKITWVTLLIVAFHISVLTQNENSITWNLNRIDSIGGYKTLPLNEFPFIIDIHQGKALLFDGVDDALLLNTNPLEDALEFTIEAVIKPDSSCNSSNREQRFIHIRNGLDDNRRILLELRLYADQKWVFDTFIKSENSRCTLIDTTKKHDTGKWYHVSLVYKNGTMTHYVNGVKELSGKVEYLPITNGKVSIGARQDPRNWFKGVIQTIKFSKHALEPEEFLQIPVNKNRM